MNAAISNFKIISGGQTGSDRAALDFALEHRIPCGGFCPRGRKAEDGRIRDRYPLTETSSADYPVRTEKNIVESDGTVILTITPHLSGGSKLTAALAAKHKKPWIHISRETAEPGKELADFIQRHNIRVLNVAGPRASKEAEVGAFVIEVLTQVFGVSPWPKRNGGSKMIWLPRRAPLLCVLP